jgi:hypothetical protein
MAPIGNYPHLFTIITNDGLSDRLLMQSFSMHDARYKLKLHARQTESKRSAKRNKYAKHYGKYERGSKRM